MGWGQMILLDDIGQQHDLAEHIAEIGVLRQRLNKASMRQASSADELRRLTVENNELKLYVSTIFRLLLDKEIFTLDEIEAVVREVDCEDGVEDGRRKGPVLSK
jgi:hypothetical protein